MVFANARLILPDRIQLGSLVVNGGRIESIGGDGQCGPAEEIVECGGAYLAPGFIDLHVHGAVRRDAMEASRDAIEAICRYHIRGGTTALTLTTVSATHEDILRVINAAAEAQRNPVLGAQVLGVHIEGPYFSPEMPGAHDPSLIRHPNPVEYEAWINLAGNIRQMTIAPELPGALRLIEVLSEQGIRASGGHSNAWDEEASAAFAHGMRQTTHTFNCMSSARRRGPYRAAGLLEFALSEPEMLCEVIADGRHVSPTLLRLLYQAKGPDGILLVTDATAGAGLAEGEDFQLLDIRCAVRDGVGMTAEGTALAGSTATMGRCVKNMVQLAGAPLVEAVRMATSNPARALGIEADAGMIKPGARADFVVLDDNLEVVRTVIGGESVYLRN